MHPTYRQVARELYPTVTEMQREARKATPRVRTGSLPTDPEVWASRRVPPPTMLEPEERHLRLVEPPLEAASEHTLEEIARLAREHYGRGA